MAVPLDVVLRWLVWDDGGLTPGLALGFTLICGAGGRVFAVIMIKIVESAYRH